MGRTTNLRRELKRRFYPVAVAHGFNIDMTHGPFSVDFRRIRPDGIDVFDLQWEKYGSTRCWFCQDHSFFRRVLLRQQDRPASEVVDGLLSLFPELEDWFQNGRLGPHMSIINYPWRDRAKTVA